MKKHVFFVRIPFLCAMLGLVSMGIFSKRGWLDWRRMLEHNNRLDQQIEAAKTQREDLEKQIQALELSPFAQEQAVRQHLGYLRKDELIIEMP
jgi:cell division protein FtsB